ncbi:MAG TPA: helix-turn-helix domain-containing protein [Gammaproteobacteria bacterium]|nr:helix-turn-helix domain-containing protein [Gammaproteobacteria bacterium]
MDLNTSLKELGFSDYEARAYITLIRGGGLTGYEIAKRSGIPRANIYAVLKKLMTQRNAVRRFETPNGVRYKALAPDQLLDGLAQDHQQALDDARQAFAAITPNAEAAPVFNFTGHSELLDQARQILDATKKSLLIAIQPPEASALADSLRSARDRGISITTFCMQACATECGGCQGAIHRHCAATHGPARWLLVVADEHSLLAGEIRDDRTTAIATEQLLITELAASYIHQSLVLATLVNDLGEEFHGLLSRQAIQILDALHPEDGFLAHVRIMSGEAV